MKKVLIIILAVILALGAVSAGFLYYMGYYDDLHFEEKAVGPFEFVYEEYTGPYKNVGPIMDELYGYLEMDGIETTVGLGVYFDDPKKVPEHELRSEVGSILGEVDSETMVFLRENYNVRTVDSIDAIVTEFPYKNMMSVILGVFKVYPSFEVYFAETDFEPGVALEIYDLEAGTITYAMEKM